MKYVVAIVIFIIYVSVDFYIQQAKPNFFMWAVISMLVVQNFYYSKEDKTK